MSGSALHWDSESESRRNAVRELVQAANEGVADAQFAANCTSLARTDFGWTRVKHSHGIIAQPQQDTREHYLHWVTAMHRIAGFHAIQAAQCTAGTRQLSWVTWGHSAA